MTFVDTFTRADSDTVGNGWVEDVGSWEVLTNELRNKTNATGLIRQPAVFTGPDQRGYVVITAIAGSNYPGVVLRLNSDAATYDGYTFRYQSGQYQIVPVVNGAGTGAVGTPLTEAAPALPFTLSAEVTGGTLNLYAVAGTVPSYDPANLKTTYSDASVSSETVANGRSLGVRVQSALGQTVTEVGGDDGPSSPVPPSVTALEREVAGVVGSPVTIGVSVVLGDSPVDHYTATAFTAGATVAPTLTDNGDGTFTFTPTEPGAYMWDVTATATDTLESGPARISVAVTRAEVIPKVRIGGAWVDADLRGRT